MARRRGAQRHRKHAIAQPPHRDRRTPFDRFAEIGTKLVSHAWFFSACLLSVLLWATWGPATGFSNTWQLLINTATTIVTFLLVALLQNSERRANQAMQHKLDAIADALADFMQKSKQSLHSDVRELTEAVGLEEREGLEAKSPARRS